MDAMINEKKEIWLAQNKVYKVQLLHGNVSIESILGVQKTKHIEMLMDKLDAVNETY